MSQPSVDNQTKPPSPDAIVLFLSVLAILCAAFGTLLALALVVADLETRSLTFARMLLAVASLLGGLAAGGLLWAASWIVRRVDKAASADRTPSAAELPMVSPLIPVPTPGHGEEVLKYILQELREIGRNVMLSPRERRARAVRQGNRQAEELAAAADKAIGAHEFDVAQMNLDGLARETPDDPRLADLRARLAQARQSTVVQELQQVSQRTMDLMAVSSFAEAQRLADELLARYPDTPEVVTLAEHVRREATSFTTEQRRRMYREIEVHAENRRWRQAVVSANKFLQAYPAGAEADLVRVQMPTMQTNATIEEVRDLRNRILDYMDRRRYLEAIELSRDVINRFPKVAVAEELRQQLPRLLELAKANPSVRP